MSVTAEPSASGSTSLLEHAQTHRSLHRFRQVNDSGKQTLTVLSRNRDILRETLLDIKNGAFERDVVSLVERGQACKQIDLTQFAASVSPEKLPGLSISQLNSMNLENRRLNEKLTTVMSEITRLLDFMAGLNDVSPEKRATNAWRKRMAVLLNNTFE